MYRATSFRTALVPAVLAIATLTVSATAHAGATCSTVDSYQMAPWQLSSYGAFAQNSRNGMFVAGVTTDAKGVAHWVFKVATGVGAIEQLAWKTYDDFTAFPGVAATANVTSLAFDSKDVAYETGFASDGVSSHWLVRQITIDPSRNIVTATTIDDFQLAPGQDARAQSVVVNPVTGTVLVAGWAKDANGQAHGIIRQAIPWNGKIMWYTLSDLQIAKGRDTFLFNLAMSPKGRAYATYTAIDAQGVSHWIVKSLESGALTLGNVLDSTGVANAGAGGYATTVDRAGNVLSAGINLGAAVRWVVKTLAGNNVSSDVDVFLYDANLPYAPQSSVPTSIKADPTNGTVVVAGVARDAKGRTHAVVRRGASFAGSFSTVDDFQLVKAEDAGAMAAVPDAFGLLHVLGYAFDGLSFHATHRVCR